MAEDVTKIITFTLGDVSNDGHGKTSTFATISNLSKTELQERYEALVDKTGIDIRNICEDYEDHEITEEVQQKLKDIGIAFDYDNFDPEFVVDTDIFNILIQFINLGLKPGEYLKGLDTDDFCTTRYLDNGSRYFYRFGYGVFGD